MPYAPVTKGPISVTKTVSSMNDNSFKCRIKWNFVQMYCKEFSECQKTKTKKSKLKGRKGLSNKGCLCQQRSW